MNQKTDLRRQLRQARRQIPLHKRRLAQKRVAAQLKRYWRRGACVGVYAAAGGELDLSPALDAARRCGVQLFFPYIPKRGRRLWFTHEGGKAYRGKFGITQFSGKKRRMHELSLVILPLVGIDMRGVRLGQGGGFYDTSIAALRGRRRPWLIGVGFACQMLDFIPADAHDCPIDGWIDETGTRFFQTAHH